jgi:hypothetical protein
MLAGPAHYIDFFSGKVGKHRRVVIDHVIGNSFRKAL